MKAITFSDGGSPERCNLRTTRRTSGSSARSTFEGFAFSILAVCCLLFGLEHRSFAAPAPPANFAVEDVLTNLEQPMAVRFFPDGRMLVIQKRGIVRIVNVLTSPIQSDVYMNLADPSHAHGLDSDQERGLLDIAIDPNFSTSPYVYILYTPATGPNGPRMRVARFTHVANSNGVTSRGNMASELILWQDTQAYDSCCHFGGGLDFGPDGRLFVTTGDHFQGSYATSRQMAGGKVHRINKDGSIPPGNPYADGTGPNMDSIFAYGLRNPFRARWDLPSGRFFIGEVGGNTQSIAWEDLHVLRYLSSSGRFVDADLGTASDNNRFDGINYGWPTVEGLPPHTNFPGAVIDAAMGEPIFAWRHSGITSAITGGVVYRGTVFPAQYQGAYFYADSTRDFIRYLRFATNGSLIPNPSPAAISSKNPDTTSYPFDLTPLGRVVALEPGPNGALYYVSFTDSGGAFGEPNPSILGAVRRYVYDNGNVRPVIAEFSATPLAGPSPLAVTFRIRASDPNNNPMTYVLRYGDGTTSGAPQPLAANTLVTVPRTYTTHGVRQAVLEVMDASLTATQSLSIQVGTPPSITSLTSSNSRPGSTSNAFRFGDVITFTATATDPQDGTMTGANFSWSIAFIRPGNTHPAFGPQTGAASINFPIPSQGQGFSGPVYYRCFLTVTDSSGLSTSSSIDIFPEKSNITFDTVPSGIVVQVDGNTARATPFVLDTLINFNHLITVPSIQCINGTQYDFTGWSNGALGAQQIYNVPATDSSLTASYAPGGPCPEPPASGLVMRLTGNAGVVVSGANVLSWEDQTTFYNDLGAVGGPTLLSSGPNSQPAVHFDGVDDALFRTGFTGLPTGAAARSLFMVVRYNAVNTSTGSWAGFSYGTYASAQMFGLALTPSGTLGVQGFGSFDVPSNPPASGVGAWLTQGAVYSGGTLNQFKNGNSIGTASQSFSTGTSGIRLGEELNGGKNLDMDVAEVLVYNRAVSAVERLQIEGYFSQRYAIATAGGNTGPTVSITAPSNGSSFPTGTTVTFTATADDVQQGNLSAGLNWVSSLNGPIGTGASISVSSLSAGNHTITALVADSGGLVGTAGISVTISSPSNSAPVVSITAPSNGASFASGATVTLTGAANDAQQGNMNAAINWTSSIDGPLGTGALLSVTTLSVGTHAITAAVTDSGGLTGAALVNITVTVGGIPGLVTSGLVVQLESDLNVALQTGNTVAAWLDQSGLGNDMVASGTPRLGTVLTPSGLPAVSFNGNGDKLERIGSLGGLPSGNANRTMFLVTKYNSSTWWAGVAYGTAANNASFGLNVKNPTGELVLHGYGGGNDLVSTAPGIGAGWMVQSALLNGGTATHYKDGVQIGQWAHEYDTGLTKMVLGAEIGNLGFVGMDVGALLIYNRALSAGELASVQGYLQTKYFQTAPNTPPVVAITAPASGANFTNGTAITFTGTASDTQQGNMNAALNWSSNITGALGTGASISVSSLSVGAHAITASVTDSGSLTGTASITVNITASSNTAPVVTITAPANGSSYASGTAVTFTGTANDTQQGNMNVAINWTSNINGALGTGASISVSSLSIGTHTITASVTDSGGLTGSASIMVTIGTGGSGGLITSGLVVQLESDLNVALQTGNTVAAWLDQSGLGNDTVASGTPRLGTVLTPSGLPAVSFNGNGDKLERNGFLGGLPSGNANRTMFLVTKYNSSTWWGGVAYGTAANNASFGLNVKNPTGELVLHGYGGGNDLVSTTPGIGAGWMVQSVLLNGGTATHYKDGVQIGQWAHAYDTGLTKMVIAAEIGNLGFVGMDVGALLIYNRALSAGELASVQGYLQAKYLQSGPNTPPVVTITAPSNGASFSSGIAVTFAGTASDTQQGNMNAAINWSSNINGTLGTGASISVSSLSVGAHTITASVTDSGSLTGTASITVNITASSNTAPVVTITVPASGSSYLNGATVAFAGIANDTQQGNMTAAINWSSNINGPIGTGGSISLSSLAVGTHTITASVTDSGGLTGTAGITVAIVSDSPPVTANLVVHLESAQGVTASGTSVTSWADLSGRGNTVSGVGSPQLVQARTPAGRPAITCNGTTDKLERTSGLSGLPTANANRTVIMVAKYNGSNAWAGFAYGTGASNQAFGLNVKHPSGELGLQGWGGGNDLISTTPGIGAGWLVQTGVLNSGTGTLFKDGTQIAQWAHAYNTVLSKMVIGAEIANLGFVNIEVAAVLVYDRALSASERASVEAYLRTKYL